MLHDEDHNPEIYLEYEAFSISGLPSRALHRAVREGERGICRCDTDHMK